MYRKEGLALQWWLAGGDTGSLYVRERTEREREREKREKGSKCVKKCVYSVESTGLLLPITRISP
jgi:hypothetical protein